MDSFLFFSFCVTAITFSTLLGTIIFMYYRKFEFHQKNKIMVASSSSSSSSSSLSLSYTPSSLSRNRKHHVFPSFHGSDVRKTFLTHIIKEFRRKGIDPFIDNDIERSKSIGPELIEAIRGSTIAIVLFSRNYASSSWCLNELVEITKCREELGQTVMTIFYDVDPTDVQKQTGDFGKVFKKTCKGKTNEEIQIWRKVLEGVATIAGEHSRKWDNEAAMVEKIAIDVSNMLNSSKPSRYFDGLIGMRAHMKEMESLLCLDSEEVRIIGICGPARIGKTTIARVIYSQFSDSFHLSVFMENIKELMHTIPVCSDDYSAKLHLQKQFMSQIINQKDIEIPHLGVAQDRLSKKKVLIVLDSIDQSIQLDAIVKETLWFGHGSRIIITTQDQKLLKAHDINYIYKVEFPSTYEAYQIFCMNAFGQNFPKDGFEELAWQITKLLGELPLGLRVMGSHFRGMSKQEWINALPRIRTRLDSSIQSILKFSYDALCDEDKDLFLHIACVFNYHCTEKVEGCLAHKFLDVRQGLHFLAEKSLISIQISDIDIDDRWIEMHNLLVQLGREVVRHDPRHQSTREPGKRQFLVDARDICEVLTNDSGSGSVIGINFYPPELSGDSNISERAFEVMSNLKFLRFKGPYGDKSNKSCLPQSLNYLSLKLRLLEWNWFPMTCLPSNFYTEYLVELHMQESKLHKLWEGIRPHGNLKWINLRESKNLKELPDLSTATNLQEMILTKCSSLVEVPSSIGKATNLQKLYLGMCTSLVELPSSIGYLHKLQELQLQGCSKLEVLPTNINLESLEELNLTSCLLMKSFPEISTNIKDIKLINTAIQEVPTVIKSWSRLCNLSMSYNENLKEFPHALDTITILYINDTEMQEVPPWIKKISSLQKLILEGCKKPVTLPQHPNSLQYLWVENCGSLERLDCSFHNHPKKYLKFFNRIKLNKEARELIQTSNICAFLPNRKVPANFTGPCNIGSIMILSLKQMPLSTTLRFKACVLLVKKNYEDDDGREIMVYYDIMEKDKVGVFTVPANSFIVPPFSTEHLLSFELEADVTSKELIFKFQLDSDEVVIKECGVLQN